MFPTDKLHSALNSLVACFKLDAVVVIDEHGQLIDANESCEEPEPIAATAAMVAEGTLPHHLQEESPTIARRYSMDDFDILIAAVGDKAFCEAAVDAAGIHLRRLAS